MLHVSPNAEQKNVIYLLKVYTAIHPSDILASVNEHENVILATK